MGMKNPQLQAHALLVVYPPVYAHKILKIMLIKINMAFQVLQKYWNCYYQESENTTTRLGRGISRSYI